MWEKLVEILLANSAFMVIKAAKRTRNGRLPYQLLYVHYLGPNNIGNMAGEAETVLNRIQYHGVIRPPIPLLPALLELFRGIAYAIH